MKRLLLFVVFLLPTMFINAQTGGVSIGKDSQMAHVKAILDIVSESKGLLIPRLTTTQRNKIFSKEDNSSKSLLVFDVDLNSFMYWTGKDWESLAKASNIMIADDLDSDSKTISLSARQGKILRERIEEEFLGISSILEIVSDSLSVQSEYINENNKGIFQLNNKFHVNVDSLLAHRVEIDNNRLYSEKQIGINSEGIKSNFEIINNSKTDLQLEIDKTQLGSGLENKGFYVANLNSNFIKTAVSLKDADEMLDVQLKTNADKIGNNSNEININLTAIELNKTALLSAKTDISTNTAEIVSNSASISANNNAISNNTSGITENGLGIIGNKTSLLAASAKITANSLAIFANKTSITSISESLGSRITNIQEELDSTQIGTGLGNDGSYAADVNTEYLKEAISLMDADKKLDKKIKSNSYRICCSRHKLQDEIDITQLGAGLEESGKYVANEDCNYINTAFSLKDADDKLDSLLKVNSGVITNNMDSIVANSNRITVNTAAIATASTNIASNTVVIGGKADKVVLPQVGDLQYFDGTLWKRLPKGTEGQTLVMENGLPKWSDKQKAVALITYKMAVDSGIKTAQELLDEGVTIPELIEAGIDVVGQEHGGGIIAYVNTGTSTDALGFEPGHGLIAMDRDISDGIQWYAGSNVATGATSFTDGASNTEKIVAVQGRPPGVSYAALLCDECTEGGFADWYLPSRKELDLLYDNLHEKGLGSFHIDVDYTKTIYWSSTEFDEANIHAYIQYFHDGYSDFKIKSLDFRVRCVRKF